MRLVIYYIMGVVQVVLSLTSYIPQIIKLVRTRSSEDLSLLTWVISFFLINSKQANPLLLSGGKNCGLCVISIVIPWF